MAKKRSVSTYVTSEMVTTPARSDRKVFQVRIFPKSDWGDKPFTVSISATAIASAAVPKLKTIGRQELAWAAGYCVLDLSYVRARTGPRRLSIAAIANELGDLVWRAAKKSEASLGVWCPQCDKLVTLRGSRLQLGKKFARKELFRVQCSRRHSLNVLPGALICCVRLSRSSLGRA